MSFAKFARALLAFLAGVVAVPAGWTQTYTVVYSFTGGTDGALPLGRLIQDSAGNLYGTTNGTLAGTTMGSVFRLNPHGKFKLLHNFGTGGIGGASPIAGLVRDQVGNFYGTTAGGGSADQGTVFEVDKKGKFRVVYSFVAGWDGAQPVAPLILDASGTLYGTTFLGGTVNCDPNFGVGCGVVFKVDPTTGKEKVLHRSFSSRKLGDLPDGGLLQDGTGNLYGTNSFGGPAGNGTVFKLDSADNMTVLHAFQSQSDGAQPRSELIQDAAGNIYGTTIDGDSPLQGGGVIFKIDPQGNGTVLYSFSFFTGVNPTAGVIMDSAGNFYGTTFHGGTVNQACPQGCGVVFKVDPSGKETVLYGFSGGPDGASPFAGLVMDAAGNLYGTAQYGGTFNSNCPAGCGVVFKITP